MKSDAYDAHDTHDAGLRIDYQSGTVAYLSDESDRKRLSLQNPRPDGYLGTTVARPVLVLLSVAQLQKSQDSLLLFYGSRSHIRLFLYFKSTETLLTTKHEFRWRNQDTLDLFGVSIMAMLLRSQHAVCYNTPEYFDDIFSFMTYPSTGFSPAMSRSSINLSKAILRL